MIVETHPSSTILVRWLDKVAVGMAAICAVHCLITPVLLVALPILATTFWVHQDFHLWMIGLVVPTTALAVMMGCRRHKDRKVVIFSAVGIALLVGAILAGLPHHSHAGGATIDPSSSATIVSGHTHAGCCPTATIDQPNHHHSHLHPESILTTLGGLFLVAGHIRNYRLCRRS